MPSLAAGSIQAKLHAWRWPSAGTLGILLRLVREKHLSLVAANRFLAEMVQQRYRSPVYELDDLV